MTAVRRALTAFLTAFALLLLGLVAAPPASAADPAILTGTVVDAHGAPVANADVALCLWGDAGIDCDTDYATTTSSIGHYGFDMADLEAGATYTLRFSADGYWRTWLGGTLDEPESPAAGNSVQVNATSVTLADVTLAQQYFLTGKVTDQHATPVSDVFVGLFPDDSDLSEGAAIAGDSTSSGGSFTITIPADADGTHYVLATNDEGGDFAVHVETVTLAQVDKDLGTIALTGSRATVTGTVTDSTGNPLADVQVTSMVWDTDRAEFIEYGSTSTGEDGTYSVKVKAGDRFTVRYEQSKFSTEYLGGGRTRPTHADDPVATRLAAAAGEANDPLPVVVLDPTWQLSGRLVTGVDDAVRDAEVRAYPVGHIAGDEPVSTYSSDSDGGFYLSLPAGSYDLEIAVEDASPLVVATTRTSVQVSDDTDLGDITLAPVGNAVSGRVISAAGPVADARVTSYLWLDGSWEPGVSAFTGADGSFVVPVKDGATFTVRARRNGFQTGWMGSLLVKPTEPQPSNSAVSAVGASAGDVTLFPSTDKLGKVAGQDLVYCTAHTLRSNDDDSTGAVRLPFALKYFGQAYSSLYVNNNGNVTFGQPVSQYTPGDLTSGDQEAPMIAPFFADVDTRNDASWEVTYGASPDGKTFCVNWSTVGYFGEKADKLNIFQLLLTSRSAAAGRSDGDFDITMNYDQIQWETGDASDGTGGLGGTSAAVGYTAGTGDPGTYFELAGSREPGSFIDAGPRALVAHQLNSAQPGRYIFPIRNADAAVLLGGIKGSLVRAADHHPVAGASLTACRMVNGNPTRCQYSTTGADGSYSFPVAPVGDYRVDVSPPGTLRETTLTATVEAGRTTDLGTTSLTEPIPMPAGTHLTSIDTENGVPVVYYAEALTLSVPNPCVPMTSASGTWRVLDTSGGVVRNGTLAVVGGALAGSIPALYPYHGEGTVETTVTCAGAPAASPSFDVYIDPSGTVYDEYGIPAAGAAVTLERADDASGPFTAVPSGSTIMSSGNRDNPVTVGPDGRFHWDVATGWYRLVVAKSGCTTRTGDAMEIPPAQVDLVIKLRCGAPTPTKALAISGSPAVGAVLTAVAADYGLPSTGFRWLRGTTQVATGQSYMVTEADLGHRIVLEQSFQAAAATTAGGSEVTFAPLKVTAGVDAPLHALTATPVPTVSGKAKAGSKLKAKVGTWGPAPVSLTYAWLRSGTVIRGATGLTYKVQAADGGSRITFRVTGSKAAYATVEKLSAPTRAVPLSKLKTHPAKIKGTPRVGATLVAVSGKWTSGTSFTYQWLRAGVPVAGATGPSYLLTAADLGKSLKVRITGTKQGYKTVVKIAKPTKKVK